ncbi:MAG: transposase [Alphaproteobacteria bacterium]|nr:transposase [Alphaproteobacteria bacterium]
MRNLHLEAISAHVEKDSHAAIIIDGADRHKEGGKLCVPKNITLIRLPAYSPELNAQENIWEYLRPNYLAGKVFDTYDDIVDGCCAAWNALIATSGKIKSIASRNWLNLPQVSFYGH